MSELIVALPESKSHLFNFRVSLQGFVLLLFLFASLNSRGSCLLGSVFLFLSGHAATTLFSLENLETRFGIIGYVYVVLSIVLCLFDNQSALAGIRRLLPSGILARCVTVFVCSYGI
uniref:Uncharacterized protein n=1 Tax=Physcomitrium patens TaxID=3218 RepID=A0A2K1JE40_PHYPA|nr:hypothetical protein PHYPA_020075 [Physcomitrium patens]